MTTHVKFAVLFTALARSLFSQATPINQPRTISDNNALNDKSFAAECAAAVSASLTLQLTRQWKSVPSQTISCNIEAIQDGSLQPAAGQTLTLTGTFDGDLTQHFDTSLGGKIVFGTGFTVKTDYPQWWGAKCNGGTSDDTTAIQAALSAGGSITFLGNCGMSGPTTLVNGDNLHCEGCTITILASYRDIESQCLFCNFTGNNLNPTTFTALGPLSFDGFTFKSQSLTAQTAIAFPIIISGVGSGTVPNGIRITNVLVNGVYGGGPILFEADNVRVDGLECTAWKSEVPLRSGACLSLLGIQDFTLDHLNVHNSNPQAWHALYISNWTRASMHGRVSNFLIHDIYRGDGITTEVNNEPRYDRDISFDNGSIYNLPGGEGMSLAGQFQVSNVYMDAVTSGIMCLPGEGTVLDIQLVNIHVSNTTSGTYGGVSCLGSPSGTDRFLMENSSVLASAAQGIGVTQMLSVDIHNNIVAKTQQEGIYVEKVTGRINVAGNHVSDTGLTSGAAAAIIAGSPTIPIVVANNVVDFPMGAANKPAYGVQYTAGQGNIAWPNNVASGSKAAYSPNVTPPYLMLGPYVTWSQAASACNGDANHLGWVAISDANTSVRGATLSSGGGSAKVIAFCAPDGKLTVN